MGTGARIQRGFSRLSLAIGGLLLVPAVFAGLVASYDLLTGHADRFRDMSGVAMSLLVAGGAAFALTRLVGWVLSGFFE